MDQGFPKFELEQVFRSDAADILAAGDEVEMAFRRVLRRKLPRSYYVRHGHIVDQELHQSPQLDNS